MKSAIVIAVVSAGVFLGALCRGDEPVPDGKEPPVRLKKKNKPGSETLEKPKLDEGPLSPKEENKKLDPPRLQDPKEEPEPAADEAEVDQQEMLNRIAKNVRSAENRLANRELGEDTKQVQRDILDDLDRLIDQDQNANSNSSSSSSDSSPSASKSDKKSQSKQMAQGRKRRGKNQSGQQMASNQPGQKPQSKSGQQPGGKPNDLRGGKNDPEGGPDKLADLYKDVWGHLPETLRAEMNAYASREEFMAKYRDLLKQYYTTIAEKGQRKGD
ncbi:MAG TPA: hypothetical protein VGZ25_11720 [Gemmataceae bacterium]|nr:hypothetical protein [Gemmataceae bacterium]